jgi:hypothetical protein
VSGRWTSEGIRRVGEGRLRGMWAMTGTRSLGKPCLVLHLGTRVFQPHPDLFSVVGTPSISFPRNCLTR